MFIILVYNQLLCVDIIVQDADDFVAVTGLLEMASFSYQRSYISLITVRYFD